MREEHYITMENGRKLNKQTVDVSIAPTANNSKVNVGDPTRHVELAVTSAKTAFVNEMQLTPEAKADIWKSFKWH